MKNCCVCEEIYKRNVPAVRRVEFPKWVMRQTAPDSYAGESWVCHFCMVCYGAAMPDILNRRAVSGVNFPVKITTYPEGEEIERFECGGFWGGVQFWSKL